MKIKLTKKNYVLVMCIINVFVKRKTIFMEHLENNKNIFKPFIGGKCFVHFLFKENKKDENPILGFFAKTSEHSFPLYENAEIEITNKKLVLTTKTPISKETIVFIHKNYSKSEEQKAIMESVLENFTNHLYSLDYFSELYDRYVYRAARDLMDEFIASFQNELKKTQYEEKIVYSIAKQHPTLENKRCDCRVEVDVKKFKKTGVLSESFVLTIHDINDEPPITKTFCSINLCIQDILIFLEDICEDEDDVSKFDVSDYDDYNYDDDFFCDEE